MNVIICEDEVYYREAISRVVDEWKQVTQHPDVTYMTFSSSEDFLERWENGLISDLLFLDIEIPNEMNGLELAKQIRKRDRDVPIVFVTNYQNYVYDGYVVNALRYLKKPIQYADVAACLDIAYRRYSLLSQNGFAIESREGSFVVRYSEIISVEAQSHELLVSVCHSEEAHRVRSRLSDFAAKLPAELFVQCHRSYIVNLQHIRRFTSAEVTMSNGSRIPVSQTYVAKLKKTFDLFYSGARKYDVRRRRGQMNE